MYIKKLSREALLEKLIIYIYKPDMSVDMCT